MAEALIKYKPSLKGIAQLGVQGFVEVHLLIISKVIAQNCGFDLQETLIKVQACQCTVVDMNTVSQR